MPMYDARCNICGKVHEYFTKVNDRERTPVCCETPTERILTKGPMGFVDNPAFMSKYKKMY